MNEKKQPMEYTAEPAVESSYQTGSTNPPKNHAGLVSFLLSAVIFFCGLSTIFSLMRINLLQAWTQKAQNQQCTMAFAAPKQTAALSENAQPLTISGHTVPVFWQHYHALPQGLYITGISTSHVLHAGDILLQLDGEPVWDLESLETAWETRCTGNTVCVTVYRDGTYRQLQLTIDN